MFPVTRTDKRSYKKKGILLCYKARQTDLMLYNTLTEKLKFLREKSCKGNYFEYPFKFGSSKHKDVVKMNQTKPGYPNPKQSVLV